MYSKYSILITKFELINHGKKNVLEASEFIEIGFTRDNTLSIFLPSDS